MKKTFFILSLIFLLCSRLEANNNIDNLEQNISDSVITTKITAKFAKNGNLNPLKIYVSTHQGMVTLYGHVKDKDAFVTALQLAKKTKGVVGIDTDDLVIKPVNTVITDTYITAKVEAAVLKAKVFDDDSIPLVGINAKTINGTVTLSGKLPSNKAILAVVKRVTEVKGVKKIISLLEIGKEAT